MEKLGNINEFGKIIAGRNYHHKNQLKTLDTVVDGHRSKQIEVGQVVYETDKLLQSLFSPEIISEIKIQSYKNNNLYLSTANSLIAQELKFEKETILNTLKKTFKVKDLVIILKSHNQEEYN